MVKLVIEYNLDATRIFNMDVSPFLTRKKQTALALRGSSNVWTIEPPLPVHVSYVACVSAAGDILPPLFVILGARVTGEIAATAASIPDCRVTCSEKGFITSAIFFEWLEMLDAVEPSTVVRPIVLTFDGYSSLISLNHRARRGAGHPARLSASQRYPPCPTTVRCGLLTAQEGGEEKCMRSLNCRSGFAGTGLHPPSLPRMYERLHLFESGDLCKRHKQLGDKENTTAKTKGKVWNVSWCKRQEIRQAVLHLPVAVATDASK